MGRMSHAVAWLLAAALTSAATNPTPVEVRQQVVTRTVQVEVQDGDRIRELESRVVELERVVERKDERLRQSVEWRGNVQARLYAANRHISVLEAQATETLADLDEEWRAGYLASGGRNLDIFNNVILPCESGSRADRHVVVGPTDDWGRAQVNRPVWKSTFEGQMGMPFERAVTIPALNGYMAAYIEDVQGLTAWTCARINGIG